MGEEEIPSHFLLSPYSFPVQPCYSYLAVLWGLEVPESLSYQQDPQDQGTLAPL